MTDIVLKPYKDKLGKPSHLTYLRSRRTLINLCADDSLNLKEPSQDTTFELQPFDRIENFDEDFSTGSGADGSNANPYTLHDEKYGAESEDIRTTIPLEYNIPTGKKVIALAIYFLCNVGLTLYNKAVLGSVSPLYVGLSCRVPLLTFKLTSFVTLGY